MRQPFKITQALNKRIKIMNKENLNTSTNVGDRGEVNKRVEIIEDALLDLVSGGAIDSVEMCVGHQFCEVQEGS